MSREEALRKVYSFNTIATLIFHMNYYVSAVLKVLEGAPLDSKDELSFDHPPLHSEADWQALLNKTWSEAERFATLVEQLPEERMWETFLEAKHQNYYRNIVGITEHIYYHLGQIVLIKKLIREEGV